MEKSRDAAGSVRRRVDGAGFCSSATPKFGSAYPAAQIPDRFIWFESSVFAWSEFTSLCRSRCTCTCIRSTKHLKTKSKSIRLSNCAVKNKPQLSMARNLARATIWRLKKAAGGAASLGPVACAAGSGPTALLGRAAVTQLWQGLPPSSAAPFAASAYCSQSAQSSAAADAVNRNLLLDTMDLVRVVCGGGNGDVHACCR